MSDERRPELMLQYFISLQDSFEKFRRERNLYYNIALAVAIVQFLCAANDNLVDALLQFLFGSQAGDSIGAELSENIVRLVGALALFYVAATFCHRAQVARSRAKELSELSPVLRQEVGDGSAAFFRQYAGAGRINAFTLLNGGLLIGTALGSTMMLLYVSAGEARNAVQAAEAVAAAAGPSAALDWLAKALHFTWVVVFAAFNFGAVLLVAVGFFRRPASTPGSDRLGEGAPGSSTPSPESVRR